MFMPGDEVQVKGNVAKVESLDDFGDLKTWVINQKKSSTTSTNVDKTTQPHKARRNHARLYRSTEQKGS